MDYYRGFTTNSGRDGLYRIMSESDIDELLNSDMSDEKKKDWILTELGYVRIYLRSVVDFHRREYEANNRLDESVRIMDEYVDIVKRTMGEKDKPRLINRIKDTMGIKRYDELIDYVLKWDALLEKWNESHMHINQFSRQKRYDELEYLYNMIYNLSFSSANFPQ